MKNAFIILFFLVSQSVLAVSWQTNDHADHSCYSSDDLGCVIKQKYNKEFDAMGYTIQCKGMDPELSLATRHDFPFDPITHEAHVLMRYVYTGHIKSGHDHEHFEIWEVCE